MAPLDRTIGINTFFRAMVARSSRAMTGNGRHFILFGGWHKFHYNEVAANDPEHCRPD
jgi:hypothetical protein